MGDTDIRAALLSIADADTGRLLDARLYDDLSGLGRLVAFAGDRELALRTVLAIVRGAARHGANSQIRSWGWFRSAIAEDQAQAGLFRLGRVLGYKPELTLIMPRFDGVFFCAVTKSLPRHDMLMNGSELASFARREPCQGSLR